jgi:hypothetical protein
MKMPHRVIPPGRRETLVGRVLSELCGYSEALALPRGGHEFKQSLKVWEAGLALFFNVFQASRPNPNANVLLAAPLPIDLRRFADKLAGET